VVDLGTKDRYPSAEEHGELEMLYTLMPNLGDTDGSCETD
jgi:hypothetical protein